MVQFMKFVVGMVFLALSLVVVALTVLLVAPKKEARDVSITKEDLATFLSDPYMFDDRGGSLVFICPSKAFARATREYLTYGEFFRIGLSGNWKIEYVGDPIDSLDTCKKDSKQSFSGRGNFLERNPGLVRSY